MSDAKRLLARMVMSEHLEEAEDEILRLKVENRRLTALIEGHNEEMAGICESGANQHLCTSYRDGSRRCTNCPKDYMISMEGE